ncbi:hypothetical protein BJX70DRAFT_378419, partial [Aspergillus crustosus]
YPVIKDSQSLSDLGILYFIHCLENLIPEEIEVNKISLIFIREMSRFNIKYLGSLSLYPICLFYWLGSNKAGVKINQQLIISKESNILFDNFNNLAFLKNWDSGRDQEKASSPCKYRDEYTCLLKCDQAYKSSLIKLKQAIYYSCFNLFIPENWDQFPYIILDIADEVFKVLEKEECLTLTASKYALSIYLLYANLGYN